MRTIELFRDLYRHTEWADALAWSAVLPSSSLLEDDKLRERLWHIHLVQRAFLQIWRGEPLKFEGSEALRGNDLARWGRTYHGDVPRLLGGLDDDALDRPVQLPWAAHFEGKYGSTFVPPSLGETVMQVAMHSAHHRGQVLARIRELGVEPPLTDFIAWNWFGKPAPSWPEGTA